MLGEETGTGRPMLHDFMPMWNLRVLNKKHRCWTEGAELAEEKETLGRCWSGHKISGRRNKFKCSLAHTITTVVPIYCALEETENEAVAVMTSAPWNGTQEKMTTC